MATRQIQACDPMRDFWGSQIYSRRVASSGASMRILNPAVLAVALLSAGSAVAGEPPKGKSEQASAHDSHGTVTFTGGQRDAVRSYYTEQHGKGNCPPGLAK